MDWPFRKTEGGGIEQFNRTRQAWGLVSATAEPSGYRVSNWTDNEGRHFARVHTITWMTYNGPLPIGYELDHIDGDKANNLIHNLRLVTHGQNMRYARERLGNWSPSKLTDGRRSLLLALPAGWKCLRALAERWSMSKFHLANMRRIAKANNDPRYQATL